MWDQFESSARLLPSPEEKKEPEVSSPKEVPGLQSLIAREEENTVAFAGGLQQDLFPAPSDAEQATFAFYGATQDEETPGACPEKKGTTAVVAPAFQGQSQASVISATDNTGQIKEAVSVPGDEVLAVNGDEVLEVRGEEVLAVPVEEAVAVPGDEVATVPDAEAVAAPGEAVAVVGEEVLEVPLEQSTATPENKLVVARRDISVPAGDEKVIDKEKETKMSEIVETKAENVNGVRDGKDAKAFAGRDPKTQRPFRVKLRGSVLVLVRLPNKRSVRGAFHQLSTSGGVIHLEKPLDEKLEVELIFHIHEKTIRNHAQMLFPMWATQGWMQPFRFVDLADKSREILDASLRTFLGDMTKGAGAGA